MNSEKKAIAYLEHIQKTTYEFLGIEPRWKSPDRAEFDEAFLKKFYESLVRERRGLTFDEFRQTVLGALSSDAETTISSYQDPAWYFVLRTLAPKQALKSLLPRSRNCQIFWAPPCLSNPSNMLKGPFLRANPKLIRDSCLERMSKSAMILQSSIKGTNSAMQPALGRQKLLGNSTQVLAERQFFQVLTAF